MEGRMVTHFANNGEAFVQTSITGFKKLMRSRCRDILNSLSDEYVTAAGNAAQTALMNTSEFAEADTVFCYMNFGKEPSTGSIIDAVHRAGKRLCVPHCISDGIMEAKLYRQGDSLKKNAYGIKEPLCGAEKISPEEIDLAIIPCVACDRQGNRIGHGAGYYDRFLEQAGFTRMALCFSKLLMGNVPAYTKDIKMDIIITENEILRIERDKNGNETDNGCEFQRNLPPDHLYRI